MKPYIFDEGELMKEFQDFASLEAWKCGKSVKRQENMTLDLH